MTLFTTRKKRVSPEYRRFVLIRRTGMGVIFFTFAFLQLLKGNKLGNMLSLVLALLGLFCIISVLGVLTSRPVKKRHTGE